jgi:predicted transposase YdaD
VALVEMQTRNEREVGERLLLYTLLARMIYEKKVMPGVIYLLNDGNLPEQPYRIPVGNGKFITFPYECIYVGKMEASEIWREFPLDWLPLLPFTVGGRTPEMIDRLFEKLRQESDLFLLRTAVEFASYVLDHYNEDQSWLFRKVQNMYELQDLPIYRAVKQQAREEGLQEGRQEGRQEGLQEGLQEGRQEGLEALRSLLIDAVEQRMPKLGPLAREQAALIENPKTLRDLTFKLFSAKTLKEAQHYLLNWRDISPA